MAKKMIVSLLVIMIACSMVFAGGSSEKTPERSGSFVLEPVNSNTVEELVLWHNRGGSAGALLEKTLVPQFNETVGKQMGIKIVPVYQDNLISKFKALILANDMKNMPDMIQAFAGDTEYMSTVPFLVPASELIAADSTFDVDDILPSLINTYKYAGQLNSLPFHASTMIMYYNKTAFKEAGLDPNKPPRTLAEFADVAGKLVKKTGNNINRFAITMGVQNNYLNHFIGGQGEYSFIGNEENGHAGRMTEVEFDKNGSMKTFLTEWKKVLDTGAVQTVDEGNQARDEFMAGTSAVLFTSNSALSSMLNLFKEKNWELGVTSLPKVVATDSGSVCPGGSSVYVLDRNNNQKIAKSWEFIKWWTSPDTQATWSMGTGTIPVNAKSMQTPAMKEFLEKTPEFWVAYNALMSSNPYVQEHLAPTQQAFATIFKEVGSQFAAGQLTVDQAVESMAKQCNAALAEYNRANPIK